MENMFFQANEVGYSFSEEEQLEKVRGEDKLKFVQELSSYGNLLVIEDRHNLYQNYSSIVKLKCD